ncbi:MAG: ATP-binding protein, partial [Candidatus Kuenenia sp.]|nr:ATP-binding protein [Candidatus Kuenenia sp.]
DLHVEYDFQSDELGSRLSDSFNEMTAALKKSKEVLRNLFDAANDPMFLIKEGEQIEDINKRVTEIFGYKKESLPGNNFTSILTTKYIPMVKQAITATWNISPGQKYPTFDVAVVTRDNRELICELDLNRTDYGIQPHFRDVTEARRLGKRLEEKNKELEGTLKELKEAQAQLVQSGKLAGIGELASGVAHEINNPLTAVMGHSLRLLRKAENNEALKTMKELDPFRTELKIIADASARCKRITDGLLRFSRMSPELKVSSISINDVIADTLVLIEYSLKQKNIQLVKRLEDGSKYIKGDHNQLQQVFTNMISNAIHAMPNGGSLTIAAREIDSPQPPIKSGKVQSDKYIEIEFTDTGCGIDKEHISRIFDPFFTTKEPGKGTGLGLSISYSIIKDHGGRIDVKSILGEGTTFLITLPAG